MTRYSRLTAGAALALAAAGVAVPTAAAATPHAGGPTGQTVFVQTNDPAGNAVAVYDRGRDGTLTAAHRYATGGRGGALGGAAVDRLGSQGSLTYDRTHHVLYAANAGSDTVTVFAVVGDRLVRLQQVSSGGSFPVSVAVHGNVVYVLNARDGGSVQGYRSVAGLLFRVPAWHRALGLDAEQTPEFTSTPGQVGFTPDGTRLVVTTKGNTNGNSVDVFRLDRSGAPAAHPVTTADPAASPFAFTFDATGHLVVSEAGPNAVATFTLHRDGTLSLVDRVATGQMATCWVVTDGTGVFTGNAGSSTVSEVVDHRGDVRLSGQAGTGQGTVDLAVTNDRQYLYAQTGGNGGVDEFRINRDHSLTRIGSVVVPGSAGGEGLAST